MTLDTYCKYSIVAFAFHCIHLHFSITAILSPRHISAVSPVSQKRVQKNLLPQPLTSMLRTENKPQAPHYHVGHDYLQRWRSFSVPSVSFPPFARSNTIVLFCHRACFIGCIYSKLYPHHKSPCCTCLFNSLLGSRAAQCLACGPHPAHSFMFNR